MPFHLSEREHIPLKNRLPVPLSTRRAVRFSASLSLHEMQVAPRTNWRTFSLCRTTCHSQHAPTQQTFLRAQRDRLCPRYERPPRHWSRTGQGHYAAAPTCAVRLRPARTRGAHIAQPLMGQWRLLKALTQHHRGPVHTATTVPARRSRRAAHCARRRVETLLVY